MTKEVESCAGVSKSKLGTGGMSTKLKAAKLAVKNGVSMIIANGSTDNVIKDITSNKEIGTLFLGENKGGEI
jgi:glutamate 5-kinase